MAQAGRKLDGSGAGRRMVRTVARAAGMTSADRPNGTMIPAAGTATRGMTSAGGHVTTFHAGDGVTENGIRVRRGIRISERGA